MNNVNPRRTPIWGQYIDPRDDSINNILSNDGKLKVNTDCCRTSISAEINANQTATELIPAPGPGFRIVIKYGSIRTTSTVGKGYFHGTLRGTQFLMGMVYSSVFTSFTGFGIAVELDENTALYLTTTFGTKDTFYFIQYTIEKVID